MGQDPAAEPRECAEGGSQHRAAEPPECAEGDSQQPAAEPRECVEGDSRLPVGPRNLKEILTPLRHAVHAVVDRAAAGGLRLSSHDPPDGTIDLVLTTSYSGQGCPEAAVEMLQNYLQEFGIMLSVRTHSATDANAVCRRVLQMHTGSGKPQHVFREILDIIPTELRSKLAAKAPMLRRRLDEHVAEVTKRHGAAEGAASRSVQVKRLGSRYVRYVARRLESVDLARRAWCDRHDRECDLLPSVSAQCLHIECAGTTCVAWGGLGAHYQWLDDSSLPCLVWCTWVKRVAPHIVVHECTRTFDHHTLQHLMGADYWVSSCVTCPTDGGVPSRRPRKYTVALHRRVWAAAAEPRCRDLSRGLFHYTKANYLSLFGRRCEVDCSVYLSAIAKEIAEYQQARGAKRGPRPDKDFLSGGQRQHLLDYLAEKELHGDLVDANQSPYRGIGSRAAIERHSHGGGSGVRRICTAPTLLRGSLVYSLSHRRLLVPSEYLAIHGIAVQRLKLEGILCSYEEAFEALPSRHLLTLVGNGMHVFSVGSVLLQAVAWTLELRAQCNS